MSKLKARTAYSIAIEEKDLESSGTTLVYLKSEADKVIAEKDAEIHRLKRALWLARAERARSSALSYHLIESHPDKDAAATYKRKANKWEKVEDKCRAKAEQYK